MHKRLLGLLLAGFCILPAQAPAQAQEDTPGFTPAWYLGPAFKLDGWDFGINLRESHDKLGGLQAFYRMEPNFGTGASLMFSPQDSNFDFSLDARWILPLLSVFEPYAGVQLGYITRSTGGLSICFRPGMLAAIPGLPFQLDLYGLARYDVKEALFGNHDLNQFMLGIGAALQYKL